MSEIKAVYKADSTYNGILEMSGQNKRLQLKPEVKIIFFTTQTPCKLQSVGIVLDMLSLRVQKVF